MNIHYKQFSHPGTYVIFDKLVEELAGSGSVRRVCDVGGGANPRLPIEFVQKHSLDYVLLDVSASELDKAPEGYRKVVGDVTSEAETKDLQGSFDLIFSRMVAEHVRSGEAFHRNVFRMLAPGGTAVHIFPTLFTLPFTVNRILPETLTEAMLHVVQPHRTKTGKVGKFPAFYSWCFGPTRQQIRRIERIGYEVEEYIGVFGHEGYYQKIKPLLWLHRAKSKQLVRTPIPQLTSFAIVRFRKPLNSAVPNDRESALSGSSL